MSDIIERLRDAHSFMGDPLLKEAAAEIRRLREALRRIETLRLDDSNAHRALARAALSQKGGEHG